ncbi:phosphoglycerate transport system transcriptional regulatory proteinpgtA domain protein [Escherichia coli OK1357]|nr:phosphoglycerate transport system transcriptional regulatory proteinpgtA domain protein [Escherichia coli OK1357]
MWKMLSSEYSILLIDDDADVLDAYTQLLEQSGYRVFACNNPFEAAGVDTTRLARYCAK